jgi:nucleotide-binding universal stress UspA family protein
MLTKILYPVDLSPFSQSGLSWVANHVLEDSSELIAVHVVDPTIAGMDTPRYVRDAEISLDTLCQTMVPDNIRFRVISRAGDKKDVIPDIALAEKCTFAILPVREDEDVIPLVRKMAIPQLLLRTSDGHMPEEDVLGKIAIAVDLSRERTEKLTETMKTIIEGVRVVPEITLIHGVPLEGAQGSQVLVNKAEEALSTIEEGIKRWNENTLSELISGQPEEELPERINEIAPSLLVVGLATHGELWQLILGSTAMALIEKTACPVLIIPTP